MRTQVNGLSGLSITRAATSPLLLAWDHRATEQLVLASGIP